MNSSGDNINPFGTVLLGKLVAADFNISTDQLITLISGNKNITKIVIVNWSTSTALAAGGFYTASSKGGNTIVAAAQVYAAGLVGLVLQPTLNKAYVTGTSCYFSLTTANGSALTADI